MSVCRAAVPLPPPELPGTRSSFARLSYFLLRKEALCACASVSAIITPLPVLYIILDFLGFGRMTSFRWDHAFGASPPRLMILWHRAYAPSARSPCHLSGYVVVPLSPDALPAPAGCCLPMILRMVSGLMCASAPSSSSSVPSCGCQKSVCFRMSRAVGTEMGRLAYFFSRISFSSMGMRGPVMITASSSSFLWIAAMGLSPPRDPPLVFMPSGESSYMMARASAANPGVLPRCLSYISLIRVCAVRVIFRFISSIQPP